MTNNFPISTLSSNEDERLKALHNFTVSPLEEAYSLQSFVQLIAGVFLVPMVAIAFVEKEEALIAAGAGLCGITSFDRDDSLCKYSLLNKEAVVFENTRNEPGLAGNRLVYGELQLVFYAAAPLITKEGYCIGSVSIGDKKERHFSEQDKQRLIGFAHCIMNDLELMLNLRKKSVGLEAKEAQLKQAYKIAKIGSWEYEAETKALTISDELYEIYGIEKETNKEQLLKKIFVENKTEGAAAKPTPEEFNSHPETTNEQWKNSEGKSLYLNHFKKNIYDGNGSLLKVVGVTQDVTERVANEERLKKNEELFKALVQNCSDMIGVLDDEGNIKYISPTSFVISGYQPEELIGRNVFEFMHEEDMPVLIEELQKVAQSTNSGEPTLHRFRSKAGDWVWLESKGMNRTNDLQVGGIIINARDVTDRILLQQKLAEGQQQSQRAITSAVIKAQEREREIVGRELHDNVNQVLTTVKLYTELIADGLGDQKELVRKAQQHLQSCIDEIRSISKRLSAPTLGEIGLEDSIKELVESINLTNRIEIHYSLQAISELQIPHDMHLAVYRIIQEQLNNILKHASASAVSIELKKDESNLILHITDNGTGFDPSVKRSGIGITNMRTRAENLGGQFELRSKPGNGCQLSVSFPLNQYVA